LRLKLTNRELELNKTRQMYMDVCNEKNNMQETLKMQYDIDYDMKLRRELDSTVSTKLDEQKSYLKETWLKERSMLADEYKRQIEKSLSDIKLLKDQCETYEKQCDQLRLEKCNAEMRVSRAESELNELNEKRQLLEKSVEKQRADSEALKCLLDEANLKCAQLEGLNAKFDQEVNRLSSATKQFEVEKSDLEKQMLQLSTATKQFEVEKSDLEKQMLQLSTENRSLTETVYSQSKRLEEAEKSTDEHSKILQKLVDLEASLCTAQSKMKEYQSHSNEIQIKLTECEFQLNQSREQLRQSKETVLKQSEEICSLKANESCLIEQLSKADSLNKTLESRLKQQQTELNMKLEEHKQEWCLEREQLVKAKESELQAITDDIVKRFEQDYSAFMKTHGELIERTINSKTAEFNKEKEKLNTIHEKRISEYEANEQAMAKQIKEFKKQIQQLQQEVAVAALAATKKNDEKVDADQQTDEEEPSHSVDILHERIRSLEQVINGADEHFEQELDKLRAELEQEYKLKLEVELNKHSEQCKDLENQVDDLNAQVNSLRSQLSKATSSSTSSSSSSSSSVSSSSSAKIQMMLNASGGDENYQLASCSLEQTYRLRIDQMQEKFDSHLRELNSRYESQLRKAKIDLNENYKQALNKSKQEIEQMQSFVQRLKKTNADSDRLIDSLKQEMNKIKENHLDEITALKMSSEREKEQLKERAEKNGARANTLEKQLNESDMLMKKQLEQLKADLKLEYGAELSKMSAKMKDMMRSHANAIEKLKQQHQENSRASQLLNSLNAYTQVS
jgi:chromosome segregation ATPase